METMKDAGIDIRTFTSHSARSPSTSKARIKGLSLTMIGPKTKDSTFAKLMKGNNKSAS